MHATLALASLASFATVAFAQTIPGGYGRYPCSQVNEFGDIFADPNQCLSENLINPAGGADESLQLQGSNNDPVGAQCVEETETGAFFCGIAGAACDSDEQCDNGLCDLASNTCQGGFSQDCGGADSGCSGFLYCTNADGSVVNIPCGGVGAFCQDPFATSDDTSAEDAALIYNNFCVTGYCSNVDGNCANRFAEGEDCSADVLGCGVDGNGVQLDCITGTGGEQTCQVPSASPAAGRSRSRRSALHRRNLCPASHTACAVEGAKGFECVDISSNIEQCGACASQGGVDCTAIEGVAAVGCVAGTCEIWSCEDGFTYDAASGSCTSA
ncbi:antifreeze glycopeptide AFGP poly protein [Rhodotorula diobovata]|uniref:Antifreeze glycopeptide AFGP poly protein n=1 Tax=Rhodotorula diobovata TaxID=5288 RepID=A0A5C5G7L8_9BASI|nr:antifreeze glycopeptide AFGP poly protein [Rhodotorula diobovata]